MRRRVTNEDLDMAFGRYSRAVSGIGVERPGHTLVMGQLSGLAYQVAWREDEGGGISPSPAEILVNTKRELYEHMLTAAKMIEDISWELSK